MFHFSLDIVLQSLLLGYSAAIVAGIMGNFLVASRNSILSDTLAHVSLAGVGLGMLFHISPTIFGIFIALIASISLYFLSKQKKLPIDGVSVLLLSGGLSIAMLAVHFAGGDFEELEHFMFGSLLTVTPYEKVIFLSLISILLVCFALFYNRFMCLIFDIHFFQSRFQFQAFFEILFMMMAGVLIALSLKIIGGLLMGGLLVISVLSAQCIAKSFRISILLTILFNILGITIGVLSGLYFNTPMSSMIILSLIGIFIVIYSFF
jgi:zinc transport system permease protein